MARGLHFPPLSAEVVDSGQITDLGTVTLRGDIRSYAWDGGSDLSSGPDANATAGFFLDSSAGAGQFKSLFAEGVIVASAGSDIDWSYISNVSIENADIVSLSFDKITAGSNDASLVIGAAGSISTSNYVAGTSGVLISESLTEFNDVVVRGDLESGNWDGADPVDLSGGPDLSATDGFAMDSSVGSAQFMRSVYVGGTLELFNGTIDGRLVAGASDAMQTMITAPGGFGGIWIGLDVVNNLNNAGSIQGFNDESLNITAPASGDSVYRGFVSLSSFNELGFEAGVSIGIARNTGSNPLLYFIRCRQGEGVLVDGALRIQDGSAANPNPRFQSDPDTGPFRVGANTYGIATGGVEQVRIDSDGAINIKTPSTTGSAADLRVGASTLTPIARVTSALKYKSRVTTNVAYLADIDLIPTKHYRADDKRWRYGLIADWLADQDPLLATFDPETGEVENYDDRAVLAVLAAKINELARRVRELEGAA